MTGVANGGSFRPRALFPYAVDPGETTAGPEIRPKSLPKLFAQGKHWRRSDGTWVRVKDMHPAHRANAARMLLRDAAEYAQAVSVASLSLSLGAPDEVLESAYQEDMAREASPVEWMRSTKLYRRLTKGLPSDAVVTVSGPGIPEQVMGLPENNGDHALPAHVPVRGSGLCSVVCRHDGVNLDPTHVAALRLPKERTVTVTSGVWTKVADGVVVLHQEPGVVKLKVMTEQPAPRREATAAHAPERKYTR